MTSSKAKLYRFVTTPFNTANDHQPPLSLSPFPHFAISIQLFRENFPFRIVLRPLERRRLTLDPTTISRRDRKFSNYPSKRRWRTPSVRSRRAKLIGSARSSFLLPRSKRPTSEIFSERGDGGGGGGGSAHVFLSLPCLPSPLPRLEERFTWGVNQSRGKQADDRLAW